MFIGLDEELLPSYLTLEAKFIAVQIFERSKLSPLHVHWRAADLNPSAFKLSVGPINVVTLEYDGGLALVPILHQRLGIEN
jgi:hypothetical protein